MSRVHAVECPPDDRPGSWTTSIDTRLARFETPVRRLLDPHIPPLAARETITLVPDAHYPFHPSTGIVTDPAVVGAVLAVLDRETAADIAIAIPDTQVSADRTSRYLSYDDLFDRFDATRVRDGRRTETVEDVGEQPVAVSVPERFAHGAVIPVPSLRPTRSGPIAGGMRTLARHAAASVEGENAITAATAAIDPELALLDGTIAYAGEPSVADVLCSGPVGPVDAVATDLLGRSVEDDRALADELGSEPSPIDVEGIDLDSLRDRCPDGELPPSTGPHPAVSLAYRTYAAVSGDAVPPQLQGDSP